jgi:hypothetical protein
MTGVLSDASTQATTYWVLGGMSLMTAVTALLLPAQCAGFMFGAAPDRVVQSIIRAAAATLLTTTVVKFTLKVGMGHQPEQLHLSVPWAFNLFSDSCKASEH